jgi:PAS domain S-box-containing protein
MSQKLDSASLILVQYFENEFVPPATAFQLMESNIPLLIPHLKQKTNEHTQGILTTIKTILNASIVYIMNKDGKVIASTIYGDNESLLDKSYPFRPYFLQAIAGHKTVFEAKGVTTYEKGIYYSTPIFDAQTGTVSAVLVLKLSMDKIDFWMQKFEQIAVLLNPDGIIFSTNLKEWSYSATKSIPDEKLSMIKQTQQFGNETINNLPVDIHAKKVKIGNNLYLSKSFPTILEHWELVILQKIDWNIPLCITIFLFLVCFLFTFNSIYFFTLRERNKRQLAEFQKRENDIKSSVQKFTTIYESAVDAVMILKDGKFINCNQQTLKLFQATKEQFIGKSPYELSPEKQIDGKLSKEKANEMINKALQGKNQLFDWQHKKMSGDIFDAQISLNPYLENDQAYILAIVRDATVQKKNELVQKALFQIANAVNTTSNLHELFQTMQEILQSIMDAKNFFIALYDKETDSISLPYQKDELFEVKSFPAGKSCTAYVIQTRKSLLATEDDYNRLIATGLVEQIGPTSKILLMTPLFIDNDVIGVVAVQSYDNEDQYSLRDQEILEFVSDEIATAIKKKQIEEEREIEKAFFEQLFEASPEAIVVCDSLGTVQKINDTFTKLFYFNEAETLGHSIDELLHFNDENNEFINQFEQGNLMETETTLVRKDGISIPVSVLQKPIILGGGQLAVYRIYRDLSGKKSAEKEIESQKEHLQLINKILRHDLMNNITVINSALKLFLRNQEEHYIDSAFASIKSSIDLIKRMRDMEDYISKHENLRIYDVFELVQRHIPQNDKLNISNNAKGKILADDAVESVINNLINNVIMHAKATHLTIYNETSEDKLLLHFADNGKGIPEKVKQNVFDENFCYGKTGNTGMGLYIVKKAMQNYGGCVYLEKNEPKGTIFTLVFRGINLK